MQSKHNFEAVNRVFQDIYDKIADFSRKVVCFYGDFKQPLSVIPQGLPGQIISKCLQKTFFWEWVEIFSLFINMQFQNSSLTEGAKVEIAQFVSQLFSIEKGENMITDPDRKIMNVSWTHSYMEGTPVNLISNIYLFIATIPLITQYLTSCAILAVANVDFTWFNNLTLEIMRGEWQMSKSIDKMVDLANRETFPPEFFH